MNPRREYEVWLRASLQPATLFGLTMIAACWIGVAFVMSIERDKVLEGAIQQSENLVRLFEENTVQTFERFDQILLLLRKSLEDDPSHFNLRDWAERFGPPLYLGDREHYLTHVDAVADKLFISKPVVGRSSKKWSIFIGGDLHGTVLDALAESGLEAMRLELEITESLIINDFEGTRGALSRLRSLGISIALDDFGTGYSSLSHLQQLLFDRIKIDKSFVAEVTTRAECAAIVSTVIALGNSLGVSVTAEGVETHDQLAILRTSGCTEVQGYFFSPPTPISELRERLSANGVEVIAA